jgi:hypothetical protein
MKLITTVPFAGFYESYHSQRIDDAMEQLTWDYDGEPIPEVSSEVADKLYFTCDYTKLHRLYAKDYVEEIAQQTGLKITYESMQSPKEYNFTTDRVFAYIELEEVQRIYKELDMEQLAAYIKKRFTSRDGFSSFYSPHLSEWDDSDLSKWDHNELGALVECWLEENNYDDGYLQFNLQEFCNGEFDQWFQECIPDLSEILEPITSTFPTDYTSTDNQVLDFLNDHRETLTHIQGT